MLFLSVSFLSLLLPYSFYDTTSLSFFIRYILLFPWELLQFCNKRVQCTLGSLLEGVHISRNWNKQHILLLVIRCSFLFLSYTSVLFLFVGILFSVLNLETMRYVLLLLLYVHKLICIVTKRMDVFMNFSFYFHIIRLRKTTRLGGLNNKNN